MRPLALPRGRAACVLAVLAVGISGCNRQPSDVLGLAYVAPATLNLRNELSANNTTVAILQHGERVQILDVRRRFVRVRSEKDTEGWVDASQLLTPEQMAEFRREAEDALMLPSEGSATVFEALNMHLEPGRQSPAFARISEAASVEVLAHKLAPKNPGPPRTPVFKFDRPQPTTRRERKERPKTGFRLPPHAPPPPPENLLEPSVGSVQPPESGSKKDEATRAQEPVKPAVMEDWTLVRTKDQQCGWVLSRNLIMSIPDEVAQYAEGRRITSYFDLGAITDAEKGVRHNWLWTTLSEPAAYDFDAWRVFLWNRRRHRYETSYREHGVEGYFPVHVDPPDSSDPGRTFELITKEDDGKFWRQAYLFDGVRVHSTAKEEFHPGEAMRIAPASNEIHARTPQASWLARQWQSLKKSLTGHS